MPHHTPLLGTIVAGLVIAFLLGAIAHRLRMSPIAGYLMAGVVVGPFTPGFVADAKLAAELAEIGIILLMFGVGLHFSVRDLLAVKRIAVPGALVQITAATVMGMALAWVMGWGLGTGLFFGLALSVASTVVLLRGLQSNRLVATDRGRIAIGWLVVEDLVMVLALVLLPTVASLLSAQTALSGEVLLRNVGTVLLKITGFMGVMLFVGRRLIPVLLHWVVKTGSRELFRLAVLAVALGVAFGAAFVFDVSLALGAFFAGMILGETQLSRRAAEETLPLRDAFAVLFFVSVGMLFNPRVLVDQPLPLLATVAIIVLGKSLAAYGIVRAFGHNRETALTIAVSLAQIGEFSFVIMSLGVNLNIIPDHVHDLVLAGAIISIMLNPWLFSLVARISPIKDSNGQDLPATVAPVHAVLIGYGRVGHLIARELKKRSYNIVIVEEQEDVALRAREDGFEVLIGNGTDPAVLVCIEIKRARVLLVATPEGYDAGAIAERARRLAPDIFIIARAHSDEEVVHLRTCGANHVIMGETEIAHRMIELVGTSGRCGTDH